jgi:plasmid stabilization system protein ParE
MQAVFPHPGRNTADRGALDSWSIRRDAAAVDDQATRRKLRELADQAYEEELRHALAPLAEAFERGRVRAASSFEISDLIHEFHRGRSRTLWGTYQGLKPDALVARRRRPRRPRERTPACGGRGVTRQPDRDLRATRAGGAVKTHPRVAVGSGRIAKKARC